MTSMAGMAINTSKRKAQHQLILKLRQRHPKDFPKKMSEKDFKVFGALNEICSTSIASYPDPFWTLGDAVLQHFFVAYNFHERSMSFFPREGLKHDDEDLVAQTGSVARALTQRELLLTI